MGRRRPPKARLACCYTMSFLWPQVMLATQSAQRTTESDFDWVGLIMAIGLVGLAAFIGLAMRWRRRSAGRGDGPEQ